MSKSYTLNRDAIFFFFGVGRVKVNVVKTGLKGKSDQYSQQRVETGIILTQCPNRFCY
jgi:hypothetical protein